MSNFDIVKEINKITDMNSMTDFVIIGIVVTIVGYIGFNLATGSVPGIAGMVLPSAAGAILGAMLYIFVSGTS